jgi:AcrR family transcriptional regulator
MTSANIARMSGRTRTRIGKQWGRAEIARAALDVIDRDGLESLSMRRVAAELHIDPMRLYRSVPNRDGMICDVVALLLDEMDTSEQPGETWDQTMRRVSISERDMALRHPHAFPLVALAPRDEEPVLGHANVLMELLTKGGLPADRFFDVWLVDAAFSNGFLLLATATLTRPEDPKESDVPTGTPHREDELAAKMAATLSEEAFARGLDLIYAGLKDTFSREQGPTQ